MVPEMIPLLLSMLRPLGKPVFVNAGGNT